MKLLDLSWCFLCRLEQTLQTLPGPEDRKRILDLEEQIREMSLKLKMKDEELACAEQKIAALISQAPNTSMHEEAELQSTAEESSCATSSTSDTCLRVVALEDPTPASKGQICKLHQT
jgi:hypothetical protein